MKQLIFDSKIRLVESNFKLNSAVSKSNDVLLLTAYSVINEFTSVINASSILKNNDLNFYKLGTSDKSYAIVEIEADNMVYLKFSIENVSYFLKTSSFSYKNNIEKINNVEILNGTLNKVSEYDYVYEQVNSSRDVNVNYVLISDFNYNYLNSENYPYA